MKKIVIFMSGMVIFIAGVTLILFWWADVMRLFRGGIGVVLALAGLVTLVMVKD